MPCNYKGFARATARMTVNMAVLAAKESCQTGQPLHITAFLSTLCLLAVQRVGYCYDPVCLSVCLSVCPHKTRNCEETERRTKKVLEIKVVGYDDSYSGVPSVVTSDDI
jgi:hypothetical protein